MKEADEEIVQARKHTLREHVARVAAPKTKVKRKTKDAAHESKKVKVDREVEKKRAVTDICLVLLCR